jgi:hypothetical protein
MYLSDWGPRYPYLGTWLPHVSPKRDSTQSLHAAMSFFLGRVCVRSRGAEAQRPRTGRGVGSNLLEQHERDVQNNWNTSPSTLRVGGDKSQNERRPACRWIYPEIVGPVSSRPASGGRRLGRPCRWASACPPVQSTAAKDFPIVRHTHDLSISGMCSCTYLSMYAREYEKSLCRATRASSPAPLSPSSPCHPRPTIFIKWKWVTGYYPCYRDCMPPRLPNC